MSETKTAIKVTRKEFLRGAAAGALTVAGGAIFGPKVGISPIDEVPKAVSAFVTLLPKDFGFDEKKEVSPQIVGLSKQEEIREFLETKKDWRQERLFNKRAEDLADIWTRHWLKANKLNTGDKNKDNERFQVNRKLLLEQAKEVLRFAKEIEKILDDPAVKSRLSAIANFNKLETKWKTKFTSPFFGQQELNNIRQTQISRVNLGLFVTIGLIENTSRSNLYTRLIGEQDRDYWDYYDAPYSHYDAENAHVGWNAGRYLSGQEDTSIEQYGPDDRGGVFANGLMLHSKKLAERAIVLLQPLILNLRAFNFPEIVGKDSAGKDIWKYVTNKIEVTDARGQITPNGKKLLSRYNDKEVWQSRFSEMYTGLAEFCQLYPEFKWMLTESIV